MYSQKSLKSLRLVCKKFEGDDIYSWAVFNREDIRKESKKFPILTCSDLLPDRSPIVDGLSKQDALYHKRQLEGRKVKR